MGGKREKMNVVVWLKERGRRWMLKSDGGERGMRWMLKSGGGEGGRRWMLKSGGEKKVEGGC